jgi:PKD repeat protein
VTEPTQASPGTVTDSHTYADPGVYTATLTITDSKFNSTQQVFPFIVVYDPEGGFVTGGGWIHSPPGAYPADPIMTGSAEFGFVSKYKKDATAPMGETEFEFEVAGLHFHSDTYEWLVIAGAQAMFRGSGTVNGEGDYGFMLTAVDEKLTPSTNEDLFRIKIWDKNDNDALVYDNEMDDEEDARPDTALGGGSIVIHTKK